MFLLAFNASSNIVGFSSQYAYTASLCRLVADALETFSANPIQAISVRQQAFQIYKTCRRTPDFIGNSESYPFNAHVMIYTPIPQVVDYKREAFFVLTYVFRREDTFQAEQFFVQKPYNSRSSKSRCSCH